MRDTEVLGCCGSKDDILKLHHWPIVFFGIPRPGDIIESQEGTRGRVVCVAQTDRETESGRRDPLIIVELGKVT